MRTVGTFKKIYEQAREYHLNGVVSGISDPVVRLERDGEWVIESRLEPQETTILETSLDDFQRYWNESFADKNYIPTDRDVEDYIKFVKETQIA
jgi:hypothetical protein